MNTNLKRFFQIWLAVATVMAGVGAISVGIAGGFALVDKHPLLAIPLFFLSAVTLVAGLFWIGEA